MCSSEALGLLIKLYLMPLFFHAFKRPELKLCRDAVKPLVAVVLPVDAEHGIDPGDGARADARRV